MSVNIRKITYAAMLTAMSVVIGIFCKNYLNFGAGLFRITFENLPIIISGIYLGPVFGFTVGIATDIVSYFLSGQVYPLNLIVTFGAGLVGAASGLVSHFVFKRRGYLQIILSASIAHLIGSVIVKSAGLYQFYGAAILWRVPLYIVIAGIETAIICLLYRNKNFRELTEGINAFGRKK